MFVTEPMKHLVGSVGLEDVNKVTETFLQYGVVEPIPIADLAAFEKSELITNYNSDVQQEIQSVIQQYETILTLGNISYTKVKIDNAKIQSFQAENFAKYKKYILELNNNLGKFVSSFYQLQSRIEQRCSLISALKKHIEAKSNNVDEFDRVVSIRLGKFPQNVPQSLDEKLLQNSDIFLEHKTIKSENFSLVRLIFLKSVEDSVLNILSKYSWKELPSDDNEYFNGLSYEKIIGMLGAGLKNLNFQKNKAKNELIKAILKYKKELLQKWQDLHIYKLQSQLEGNFARTENICFFSGWIPKKSIQKITETLTEKTVGRLLYEVNEATNVRSSNGTILTPPTSMKNPRILKPFEKLVQTYSTPEYNSLDPTFFTAALFFTMFGLMFADAGHGMIIGLCGLSILLFNRSKKDLGFLMCYSGIASIICGILLGNYFGTRWMSWMKPILFDLDAIVSNEPISHHSNSSVNSINDVFELSIRAGIFVIYLSYVFNWINRIRRREFIELFFDRNGVLGGWMYWIGIRILWAYTKSNYTNWGNLSSVGLTLGIPSLLLYFSEPAKYIFRKKHRSQNIFKLLFAWIGEWIINLFEYIVGSLSNTISFIRIAGLSMAHVILMTTFYEIAIEFNLITRILIMVLANVVVIALEGLSAGINSVRLNYYEFFSRFFIGNGKAYKPITVNNED